MTNEDKLKTAYDELETRLNELVDDNENGKIDDAQFSTLVAVIQMHKILLPHHEELQNLVIKLFPNIGLVFDLISKKQLTPKEEQEIKRKIKEIKDIFNNSKESKKDKEQQISEIAEQINDLLLEIVGLLSNHS
jgi:seryl-tRNA synthetase